MAMLGRTAGGLFWLSRYLERSENTARLIEAGFRMALTRTLDGEDEWESVLSSVGCLQSYHDAHASIHPDQVVDFLLRDRDNLMSVISVMRAARENARASRTALTREVWESVNESWIKLNDILERPVSSETLPEVLGSVRHQSALVRGAITGTMLRNDIFNFSQLGLHIERADNTARILDVKYYVLLPSNAPVGSSLDNVQWEMVLRSASAERSFHWLHEGDANPVSISNFLILDKRMPRSLRFSYQEIEQNLVYLSEAYEDERPCLDMARQWRTKLKTESIEDIFEDGLHEFLQGFLDQNARLGAQIETDYRFHE